MIHDELERLRRERDEFLANLTATQRRCGELLEEARAARRELAAAQRDRDAIVHLVGRVYGAPPVDEPLPGVEELREEAFRILRGLAIAGEDAATRVAAASAILDHLDREELAAGDGRVRQ